MLLFYVLYIMESLNNFFIGINENNEDIHCTIDNNINGCGKLYVHTPELSYSYNGEIKKGKMHGKGLIIYNNDSTYKSYEGSFIDNKFNGFGKLIYKNDDKFVGEFTDGKKNGIGKMYNSNGDLIMEHIWKDDIVSGNVRYVEYHHNTKIPKLIGILQNSIHTGPWIYIKLDGIVEKIEYYNECDDTLIGKIETDSNGYITVQKIECNSNISNEDLALQRYKSFSEQIKINTKKTLLQEVVDKYIELAVSLSNFACPTILSDHMLLLYRKTDDNFKQIKEVINGKTYERIIFFDKPGKYQNVVVRKSLTDDNSKCSIYEVDSTKKDNILVLYYDGEVNKLYQPHGDGDVYVKGKIKFTGTFSYGDLVNGTQFEESYTYYYGTFKNNLPDGEGTFYNSNGTKIYEGKVMNGKRHGHGISYWETTKEKNWEGGWINNMKHGKGLLYDDFGTLICSCFHEYDQMVTVS